MDLKNNLLLVIITGLVTLLLGFGAGVLLAKSTASSNPITTQIVTIPSSDLTPDQNIEAVFKQIKEFDQTISWSQIPTSGFQYKNTNISLQGINFVPIDKTGFTKTNSIMDFLIKDGWKLDDSVGGSGVNTSYSGYIKSINGNTYILLFGDIESKAVFKMGKI